MKVTDMHDILVVGIDVAALAASAKKAGYKVFAADYFGDQDLKQTCKNSLSIVEQKIGKSCGRLGKNFSPNGFLDLAKRLIGIHQIDAAFLASGLEDYPHFLEELDELIPIIGNSPRTIEKVRDKIRFFHELKKLAIPHPKTALAENLAEARRVAKDVGYPVIVKPLSSFGGVWVRKAKNRSELDTVFQQIAAMSQGVLIQEFVLGIDASVSFLSSQETAMVLTLNEQLLGIQEVGQREPFGYCGNIVPASASEALMDACRGIVQKIAPHFGLVGSNGIDVVISKDAIPYVIEVNPRFQGSLECVEHVLGINLVNAHVKACIEGALPSFNEKKSTCCIRLILYACQRSITPELTNLDEARDIPMPGVIVEEGEPLCSIIVEEKTRDSAFRRLWMATRLVYGMLRPKLH